MKSSSVTWLNPSSKLEKYIQVILTSKIKTTCKSILVKEKSLIKFKFSSISLSIQIRRSKLFSISTSTLIYSNSMLVFSRRFSKLLVRDSLIFLTRRSNPSLTTITTCLNRELFPFMSGLSLNGFNVFLVKKESSTWISVLESHLIAYQTALKNYLEIGVWVSLLHQRIIHMMLWETSLLRLLNLWRLKRA